MKLKGLTDEQVVQSRREHGANVLTPPQRRSMWQLYVEKYQDPIIRILLVAAAISLALSLVKGDFIETIGIFLAIFFATTVGFYFERDAAKRFDELTALSEEQPVKVVRNGRVTTIARQDVVVGDVVLVETGDEVPADGRLTEAVGLEVDESALTGEPISYKEATKTRYEVRGARCEEDSEARCEAAAEGQTYAADVVLRSSMVMSGTGCMEVTAVGDATEIGRVARQATEMTNVETPLNQQLARLAKLISKVGSTLSVAAFVVFLAHDVLTNPLWHTADYLGMADVVLRYFMMSVTLIVMAVPEGLPMAVTLALALNMRRMLKSNNLVRKLHACETMGAVTVICTDKTGTLTENRRTVREMVTLGSEDVKAPGNVADSIALNTTATHDVGNPTERALLSWLLEQGTGYQQIRDQHAISDRQPFSTERKYMSTTADGITYVKGAPEIILAMCQLSDEERADVNARLLQWQQHAMRTLAFATAPATAGKNGLEGTATLTAICAISDPLRSDVPAAVADCTKAGIEVKIVTGDTAATAMEIARQVGTVGDASATDTSWSMTGPEFEALSDEEALERVGTLKVLSRARPQDKQRLVQLLQRRGEVVAVTGDGTNDAPALNYAQVGLSLGSGTSVAKNASDITLIDDSFRSIVKAVEWGRSLYKNLQRFLYFQLVVNVAALLLVLGGAFIGTEMPLTITQILWVNLIMDTFAAMALASLPPTSDVMDERPRRADAFIISPGIGRAILGTGLLFFALTFTLLYYFERVAGIDMHELTIFFTIFVMLQWWNLLNAKTLGTNQSAFSHLRSDKGLLLVLAMVLAGQWLIVTFGYRMFRTEPLSATEWLAIIGGTSVVLWAGELYRLIRRI